jgi:RNA polymerase sigma factor (sigma-70 family)
MMTPEARELASDPLHLARARKLAGKASSRYRMPLDIAESSAYWGLVDAARKFDPDKDISFLGYATIRIFGQIADDARAWTRAERQIGSQPNVSLQAMAAEGFLSFDVAEDIGPAPDLDSEDFIRDLARHLTDREREVIERLYLDASTTTQSAVSRVMGLDHTTVNLAYKSAIKHLRYHAEWMGVAS